MNLNEKKLWLSAKHFLIFILGVLVVYLAVTSLVDSRFKMIELKTREQIAYQKALLTEISEVTSRNGADSITELIVRDCSLSERSSFDDLLGRLNNGLTNAELVELERLFGRCGAFFSERKTVMVSRLSREIEVYENYVNQLNIILDKDLNKEFSVDLWKQLAEEEKKQSDMFSKLVVLQDQIVTTLLSGKSINSDEIKNILKEVNEVQQTQVLAKLKSSEVRKELTSL